MKYAIKKKMMKNIIDKKKKKQPFDFEKGERFALSARDGADINNSYYFSAHSFLKKESVYFRLGLRGDGSAEVWAACDFNGEHYVLKENFYTAQTSPLKISREGEGWRVRFQGGLSHGGEVVPCSFDCAFAPKEKAIDFFSDMPSERTAIAMAQEKWTKEFFAEVQKNNQVHYEQEGYFTGTASVGEEEREISLPCVRDHSFGKREWNYMNNHLWLMCVSPQYQLNFSAVSYPALSLLEVGHLRVGGKYKFLTCADYNRARIVTGEIPKEFSLQMKLDDKSIVPVSVSLAAYDEYLFEGGKYRLLEGLADFTVNREICRGIFEIGFNADAGRFMNGKQTKDLKA